MLSAFVDVQQYYDHDKSLKSFENDIEEYIHKHDMSERQLAYYEKFIAHFRNLSRHNLKTPSTSSRRRGRKEQFMQQRRANTDKFRNIRKRKSSKKRNMTKKNRK